MVELGNYTPHYDKEWKGIIAYDKTKDSNKVKRILTLLYGSNYANAKYNKNIDGKWGENTQRRFDLNGFKFLDDSMNSYQNKYGEIYTWNGQDYVKDSTPKEKLVAKNYSTYHPGTILSIPFTGVDIHGLSDEEAVRRGANWRLSLDDESQWTDKRYKDMSVWMNQNPGKTEQDYVDMINRMHTGNINLIEAAAVMGSGVNSLMNVVASVGQNRNNHLFKYKKSNVILKNNTDKVLNGNGKPAPRKPNIPATVDGTNKVVGTSGVAGTKYTPGESTLDVPNAYAAGTVRGGKRVGGKYTTEHNVEVGTLNLGNHVATNVQDLKEPQSNTGIWNNVKKAGNDFLNWLNYSGSSTPHVGGRKNGRKLTLISRN